MEKLWLKSKKKTKMKKKTLKHMPKGLYFKIGLNNSYLGRTLIIIVIYT